MIDAFAVCVAVAGGPVPAGIERVPVDALIGALSRHKLVARAERLDRWSDAQREALRPHWREGAARSLAHRAELARVLPALRDAGLSAIAVKGVVLQERLFGTPVGRDHVDLDLLVDDEALAGGVRALQRLGYALRLDVPSLDGPLPTELPLIHTSTGVKLDLHQRLFAARLALGPAEAALRRHVDGDGLDALGSALLVSLTGGKDVWNTLRHLADLADTAERVDTGAWAALADRTHTRGLLDTGMRLAERVLGRPTGWRARVDGPPLDPLIQALRAPLVELPTPTRTRAYLRARERRRDRIRAVLAVPFQVNAIDLAEGRGPYVLRRVARLARAHAAKP